MSIGLKTLAMPARLPAAWVVAALAALAALPAAADPVADFYRGRTLQMIVATAPGGDYDTRARLLARHIGRHIPGEPGIVPANMPGAVGVQAANYIASIAPRDGTVMHAIMQNMAAHQAIGGQSVKFDVTKFGWIGNTTDSPNLISAWHATGITKIEQVMTQELVVGAPGTATSSVYYPLALNILVGTKFKIISGYPGGNNVNMAIERGEVGGRGSNSLAAWKSTKPDWIKEGKINHLVQIALNRHPELPNVPLLFELAKNDSDRQVLHFLSADVPLSRAYVTTPEVPADRLAALRRAFDATMKDEQFLAEAAKSQIDISPSSGEASQKIVESVLKTPPDVLARAKAILESATK
jgi:tripartite-type tricarboxylate transporter receptor subunit TctC